MSEVWQPELPLEWGDECVESTPRRSRDGYPRKNWRMPGRKHRTSRHHRYVFAKAHGLDLDAPPMVDLKVLHSCDNRVCININHLRLGTPQDNMDDKMRRGRWRGNVTDVTPAALETATPIE